MNGWQRMGVVVSVLWALAVLGYAAYERSEMPIPVFSEVTRQPERGEWSVACDRVFLDCEAYSPPSNAISAYLDAYKNAKTEEEKISVSKQMPQTTWGTSFKGLFFIVLLLPIAVLWICAYAAVFAYAWIKQGFKESQ
jgi:hypothetical protein